MTEKGYGLTTRLDLPYDEAVERTKAELKVEGRHPDGEPLNGNMPRWTMSEEDLNDLQEYLRGLE